MLLSSDREEKCLISLIVGFDNELLSLIRFLPFYFGIAQVLKCFQLVQLFPRAANPLRIPKFGSSPLSDTRAQICQRIERQNLFLENSSISLRNQLGSLKIVTMI